MTTCPNLGDALVETVALSFDLASHETGQLPKRLDQLFDNPKIRAAVERQLLARAREFSKKQRQGVALSDVSPQQFLASFADPVADVALQETKKAVKKSPEYQRLMTGVENLKCAVKAAPAGVWVDEHETLVIVILSAVALGGATVMYTTRSGDTIAKPAINLIQSAVKNGKVGTLDVTVSELKFVPSTQTIKAGVIATPTSWKRYKTSFNFHAEVKNGSVSSVKAGANTLVPLTRTLSVNAKASTDPIADMHKFMLRVSHQRHALSFDLMGAVDIDGGVASGSVGSNVSYKKDAVTAGASVKMGLSGHKKGERVYSTFVRFEL